MTPIEEIRNSFSACQRAEDRYKVIMAWGKKLPSFESKWKMEKNVVSGCQSLMYLHTEQKEGKLYFAAHSDALISAGLAALLIHFYQGKAPEWVLKTPPQFLEEFHIPASLTPGRANGLASLYLKMKQEALAALTSI